MEFNEETVRVLGKYWDDGIDAVGTEAMEFNEETVRVLSRYWDNGLDLKFENYLVWTVAVDCYNILVLDFLRKTVQIDPLVLNGYLLTNSLTAGSLEMVQYAKTVINWQQWKKSVKPRLAELQQLCVGNPLEQDLRQELINYHQNCQSPMRKKG